MKKTTSQLGALALSAALLLSLSGCGNVGETGSGQGRAADNGNESSPASSVNTDMNGSVGNGGTSTDPIDAAGKRGDTNTSTPVGVGADASGTSSSSVSGAGTNSATGMQTAPGDKGSTTNNSEGLGGAGQGQTGTNPGAGKGRGQ